jgi:hypothetical protein
MQPECTVVQLPPDIPLFIRPEGDQQHDYQGEWYQFVRRGKDSEFFVNPRPAYARDTIFTKSRLAQLFDSSLKGAVGDIEIGPSVIYSTETRYEYLPASRDTIAPDAFLTSFLYPYNSLMDTAENPRVLAIGDMPVLIQKELQARALSVDQCKQIFNETIEQWKGDGVLRFNPQLKYKEVFLLPRINYMVELLRHLSYSYKRIVAVVDADHVPYFEDGWRYMPKETQRLDSLLKVSESWVQTEAGRKRRDPLQQETFIEFVEKLAMFDVLLDPFLQENFLQLECFPYSPEGFLGHETAILNAMTFWKHYRQKYASILSQVAVSEDDLHAYQKEMGYRYADDVYNRDRGLNPEEDEYGLTAEEKAR